MPTKRTPINRSPRSQVTPQALAVFRKMLRLEKKCTCKGPDWDGYCATCIEWHELDMVLGCELRLKPWQIPACAHPRDRDAQPEPADRADAGGPAARYRMLKQALKDTGRDRG